jgi:predicted DNA-binding transcriptional regulator AlpA
VQDAACKRIVYCWSYLCPAVSIRVPSRAGHTAYRLRGIHARRSCPAMCPAVSRAERATLSADGSVAGVDGHPIVTFPPVTVAKVDHVGVHLTHPNQLVSPGNLASLADVHVATIWRAVSEGALPKPTKLSSRRVGFPLQDVQAWLAGRKAG